MGRHTERPRGRVHALTWVDRGSQHIHRWHATCSCGWVAVPGKRRWAEQQYRAHVRQVEGAYRHSGEPRRRPLTPAHQLPECLR